MFSKVSSQILGQFFEKTAAFVEGFEPGDAKLILEGKTFIDRVNSNLAKCKDPFDGVDVGDKRKLLAYIILKRENPVLGDKDNVNYESAVNTLDDTTYREERDINRVIVEQSLRLGEYVFDKTLGLDKAGNVIVSGGS